jgi:hypothetical protein
MVAGADRECGDREVAAQGLRQSYGAPYGIGALDALTSAFQGQPWIPETG